MLEGAMIVLVEVAAVIGLLLGAALLIGALAWPSYRRQGGRKGLIAWLKDL